MSPVPSPLIQLNSVKLFFSQQWSVMDPKPKHNRNPNDLSFFPDGLQWIQMTNQQERFRKSEP
jgi:hypothetical protein